ncbi:MAG: hypothetical protein MHPSP_001261, partial [Paramarteilia canceri]
VVKYPSKILELNNEISITLEPFDDSNHLDIEINEANLRFDIDECQELVDTVKKQLNQLFTFYESIKYVSSSEQMKPESSLVLGTKIKKSNVLFRHRSVEIFHIIIDKLCTNLSQQCTVITASNIVPFGGARRLLESREHEQEPSKITLKLLSGDPTSVIIDTGSLDLDFNGLFVAQILNSLQSISMLASSISEITQETEISLKKDSIFNIELVSRGKICWLTDKCPESKSLIANFKYFNLKSTLSDGITAEFSLKNTIFESVSNNLLRKRFFDIPNISLKCKMNDSQKSVEVKIENCQVDLNIESASENMAQLMILNSTISDFQQHLDPGDPNSPPMTVKIDFFHMIVNMAHNHQKYFNFDSNFTFQFFANQITTIVLTIEELKGYQCLHNAVNSQIGCIASPNLFIIKIIQQNISDSYEVCASNLNLSIYPELIGFLNALSTSLVTSKNIVTDVQQEIHNQKQNIEHIDNIWRVFFDLSSITLNIVSPESDLCLSFKSNLMLKMAIGQTRSFFNLNVSKLDIESNLVSNLKHQPISKVTK